MRRVALLLLVVACSADGPELFVRVGSPARVHTLQRLELVPDHPWTVLDPSLEGFDAIELAFVATGHSTTSTCSVEIRSGERVRALDAELMAGRCTATWDGTLDDGTPAPVGAVDAVAAITRDAEVVEAHSPLTIVRVGLDEVQLSGDGRAPLLYRALDGVRYGYFEVDTSVAPWRNHPDASEMDASAVSLEDGARRPHPAPWEDLTSPPLDPADLDGVERDAYNLPVAWVAGEPVGGRLSWIVEGAPTMLRVVSDSSSVVLADDIVEHGALIDFEATDWVPGVGRFDVELALGFESRAGDAWVRLPGTLRTTHRIYGLASHPAFEYDDLAHRSWVDVLDRIADWLPEPTADADAVGAAIVEGVFYELGLQYDSQRGASHYTSYPAGGYSDAAFNLSRFQDLADGHIINCSDAASIVSTYANMVGIDYRYHIIRHRFADGFALNYLHAIGRDWGASPFLSGRRSFRYHAVVGPADTRIYDSTLALDGDGDPGSAPHELLLVQGLTQLDYLVGLSPQWDEVRVFEDDQVRIR